MWDVDAACDRTCTFRLAQQNHLGCTEWVAVQAQTGARRVREAVMVGATRVVLVVLGCHWVGWAVRNVRASQ